MRIFPAIAVMLATALPLCAVETPILPAEEAADKPAVTETGQLLELRDPAAGNRDNTPPGALAALVARPGMVYEWTPSPDRTRVTGGADLIDAFLSPDETLLVLLENVGGRSGPNATRVLCWNLLNNRLIRAFSVPDRKLSAAAIVPGSTLFVAPQSAQEAFGQPDRLVAVDLRGGKLRHESQPLSGPVRSFAAGPDRTYVTTEGSENILMIPHETFPAKPREFRTLVPEPRLLLSPDGNTLVIYGRGRIEILNAAAAVPELVSSQELPEEFVPVQGLLPSDNAETIIFADAAGKARLLSNGLLRPLTEKFSGVACCRVADGKLFLGVEPKEAVSLYQLPNGTTPEVTVSPGELRPHTRGRNFRLFALTGTGDPELILIDNRANIFRLGVQPRRWQKKVIFSAPK